MITTEFSLGMCKVSDHPFHMELHISRVQAGMRSSSSNSICWCCFHGPTHSSRSCHSSRASIAVPVRCTFIPLVCQTGVVETWRGALSIHASHHHRVVAPVLGQSFGGRNRILPIHLLSKSWCIVASVAMARFWREERRRIGHGDGAPPMPTVQKRVVDAW